MQIATIDSRVVSRSPVRDSTGASGTTRNIYIVDDDEAVRRSLHRLLSQRGDSIVRSLASGDAFLAVRHELDPGLVLLDYHMPGASGIDVLARLAEEPRKFATVMLTAHGDVGVSVAAMKAGADDFLEKPYDPADLLACLDCAFFRLANDQRLAYLRSEAKAKLSILSPREKDVLTGLLAGQANKVIAYELGISPRTIEIYRANLMIKLNVRSLSHALRIVYTAGAMPR